MARFSADQAYDMTGGSGGNDLEPGGILYDDENFLVLGEVSDHTVYEGRFTYPDGGWEGRVTAIGQVVDLVGWWRLTGINLPTRYFMAGEDLQDAFRRGLSGDDLLFGSFQDDRLIGYAGDDRISGKGGVDVLQGGAGRDTLLGGNGKDRLSGNDGRDRLEGGNGDDRLYGGLSPDVFVFDGKDGLDRIGDFRNRLDRIEITDGARRFEQLDISRDGDDVRVAFADTVIVVEDTPLRHVGTEDFVFS